MNQKTAHFHVQSFIRVLGLLYNSCVFVRILSSKTIAICFVVVPSTALLHPLRPLRHAKAAASAHPRPTPPSHGVVRTDSPQPLWAWDLDITATHLKSANSHCFPIYLKFPGPDFRPWGPNRRSTRSWLRAPETSLKPVAMPTIMMSSNITESVPNHGQRHCNSVASTFSRSKPAKL